MKCSVVGVQLALCVLLFFVSNVALAPVDPKDVFTEAELKELTRKLARLLENDGKLPMYRLQRLLKNRKLPDGFEIQEAISLVENEDDGRIDVDGFLKLYAEIKYKGKGKSLLFEDPSETAFRAADIDGKGFLYPEEIVQALKIIYKGISDADINCILFHGGICGDVGVTLPAFQYFVLNYGPGSSSS